MNKDDAVTPKHSSEEPEKRPPLWNQIRSYYKTGHAHLSEYYRRYKKPTPSFFCRLWRFLNYDFARDNSVIALFTALVFFGTIVYSYFAYLQWQAIKESTRITQIAADAAKSAAETADRGLVLQQRPWVKIKHRIVSQLTFNAPAWKGTVATATIEDTIENVGPTVTVDVLEWEDIIPLDLNQPSTHNALKRRSEWCDANRHPDSRGLTGYVLFPKDPFVQQSHVGPKMEVVTKAAEANWVKGKIGFALVGCVCYRAPFEPKTTPTHQTRFMYYLGKVESNGGFQTLITPIGTANGVQLMSIPDGFSAD